MMKSSRAIFFENFWGSLTGNGNWDKVYLGSGTPRFDSLSRNPKEYLKKKWVGRFYHLGILNALVSTLKDWIVFCMDNGFWLKSILTSCDKLQIQSFWLQFESRNITEPIFFFFFLNRRICPLMSKEFVQTWLWIHMDFRPGWQLENLWNF